MVTIHQLADIVANAEDSGNSRESLVRLLCRH